MGNANSEDSRDEGKVHGRATVKVDYARIAEEFGPPKRSLNSTALIICVLASLVGSFIGSSVATLASRLWQPPAPAQQR